MTAENPSPRLGRYKLTVAGDEKVHAFVPPPLPPEPPLVLSQLVGRLSAADRAIGRLEGIAVLLPDHALFLYMYVRKEAVLSSQIEGTHSTMSDLLRFEADAGAGTPIDDIREVSNYVDAMMHGFERLKTLPLSLRLIREMHERLLQGSRGATSRGATSRGATSRGATKSPGEFRRSQNWIGGTRPGNAVYVPPPIDELDACLDAFEKFIHLATPDLPPLVKAGLLHVQFESIHPFLDGNGRLGRLLVTLFLCSEGVLSQPLLYLSLYLKRNRDLYYRLLQEVRERGNWETWLEFFLEGVTETAQQAFTMATRIVDLFARDRDRISQGERAGSALRLHEKMQKSPFLKASNATRLTGLSMPTVNVAFRELQRLGIVEEITGQARGRVYRYKEYLDLLNDAA